MNPALARVTALAGEPRDTARVLGQVRIAIGAAMVLAPRLATRRFLKADAASPDAVTAWRTAGARDLALGLGTLFAARRDSPAVRGWLEAGALADGLDTYAWLRDRSFHPLVRVGAGLSAAAASAGGMWAARQLDG